MEDSVALETLKSILRFNDINFDIHPAKGIVLGISNHKNKLNICHIHKNSLFGKFKYKILTTSYVLIHAFVLLQLSEL